MTLFPETISLYFLFLAVLNTIHMQKLQRVDWLRKRQLREISATKPTFLQIYGMLPSI